MKKLSIVAASVLAAALFFGCSNSSDSPLLPSSGGSDSSSSSPSLPKSVGENPFVGKTFEKETFTSLTKKFDASTYVKRVMRSISDESDWCDAYEEVTETVYDYSYNADTKRLYSLLRSDRTYVIRNGKTENVPNVEDLSF